MSNSTYEIRASFKGIENVVGGMKRIEQQIRANTSALREQMQLSAQAGRAGVQGHRLQEEGARRRARVEESALGRTLKTGEKYQRFGREMSYVWREQTAWLSSYTDETLKLYAAQQKFKLLNLKPEENERAFTAVRNTVKSLKGLTLTGVTEIIGDLHFATGNLDHSIELLNLASKFRFGMESTYPELGSQQIEKQIRDGFRYLEMTGAVAQGVGRTTKMFNEMVKISSGTVGRITPADMLLMAQKAGPSLQNLTPEGLRHLIAPMSELKAPITGTSLFTTYRAIVHGQMRESAIAEFGRLGLIDPKKVLKVNPHTGRPSRIQPGAITIGDEFMADPFKAAGTLLEAMKRKGIDTSKDSEIRKEIGILFQQSTSQRLMNILMTQRGLIEKDARNADIAKDVEGVYTQGLDSAAGKIKMFEAAIKNMKAEVGGPLVSALTSATSTMLPFIQAAAQHPVITLAAIAIGRLGMATAQTAIALRTSGLVGAMRTVTTAATAAESGGAVAGAGWGSRFALALRNPAVLGRVGGAVAIWSLVIGDMLANSENDRKAGDAGRRIGEMLSFQFQQQVKGKLSADVQRELDSMAPELAKNIVQQQGLGIGGGMLEFWKSGRKSKLVEGLEYVKQLRGFDQEPGGLNPSLRPRLKATEERVKGTLYASGIMNATQLGEYLKQAQETLRAADRLDIYPTLQRLAKDAFPQLASELEKVGRAAPAVDDFTQAIQRATGRLSAIPAPFTGSFGRTFRTPKGEFNLGEGIRPFAKGGLVTRPTLALLGEGGEPEVVSPLSKLRRLSFGVNVEQHFQVNATGTASAAEVRGAVLEASRTGKAELLREVRSLIADYIRENGLDGFTNDGFRNRLLGI